MISKAACIVILALLCASAVSAQPICSETEYWNGTQCVECNESLDGCYSCELSPLYELQCIVCYYNYQIFHGECVELKNCKNECGIHEVCNTLIGQCVNCYTRSNPFCSECAFDAITNSTNCTACAKGLKPTQLGDNCLCAGKNACADHGEVCVKDQCVSCTNSDSGVKFCKECTTNDGTNIWCEECYRPFIAKGQVCGCGMAGEVCKGDRTEFCDGMRCVECKLIHDKCVRCWTHAIVQEMLPDVEEEVVSQYRFLQKINAAQFGICEKCEGGFELRENACFAQSGTKLALSLTMLMAMLFVAFMM